MLDITDVSFTYGQTQILLLTMTFDLMLTMTFFSEFMQIC
ncbi:hypothetical protein T11_14880 [Trichinella zimbabwensis]|uniref:Uncharacterized protein n=1 Tax=Trichinella zimbabwensis TaxID=268475 RepID=A0A0V1G7H7_9BILA|nr:hypothetical protein T11_14880 [Trichinella zimbabwensis]